MPFDAQGNFTRVMNWQEDAANSIPILASRHDDEDDNFAAGFNETFCRDGRAAATGNFKMGGNKIVNLASGTNTGDAVNKGQMDTAINTAVTGKQNTITGGASTITSANLTLNRALVSNGSGKVSVSNTTSTELGYVHGVTSAIQTQIDSKQATITGAATTIASSNLTASRALVSNSSGKVAVSSTTDTELGYVHGVTSAIQTQINNAVASIATSITNTLKTLYPVNSIYIGVQSTCPLATLISGSTWEKVATKIITAVGNVSIATNNKQIKMKNDEGEYAMIARYTGGSLNIGGHTFNSDGTPLKFGTETGLAVSQTTTSLTVNIWKRTA